MSDPKSVPTSGTKFAGYEFGGEVVPPERITAAQAVAVYDDGRLLVEHFPRLRHDAQLAVLAAARAGIRGPLRAVVVGSA